MQIEIEIERERKYHTIVLTHNLKTKMTSLLYTQEKPPTKHEKKEKLQDVLT